MHCGKKKLQEMYETGRPVGKYALHKYLRLDFFYDEYNGFVKEKKKAKKKKQRDENLCV